jgi:hypothetical protein
MAEWILSQVLQPDRAASAVGDWLQDEPERGPVWFWSSVFRTVLRRIGNDFSESPAFLLGLAVRGWLYSGWLILGTGCLLVLGTFAVAGVVVLSGVVGQPVHWHPSVVVQALATQIWMGWCAFQAGRWIARRAAGRELAAGVVACIAPMIFFGAVGLFVMHFWSPEINRYVASHPAGPDPVDAFVPSEIFLLAGVFRARHESLQRIAR